MLDFLIVLGQIPGTHIQLNFFEIVLLPFVVFWLINRHRYQTVRQQLQQLAHDTQHNAAFRSFVISAVILAQKPKQRLVRHWF